MQGHATVFSETRSRTNPGMCCKGFLISGSGIPIMERFPQWSLSPSSSEFPLFYVYTRKKKRSADHDGSNDVRIEYAHLQFAKKVLYLLLS